MGLLPWVWYGGGESVRIKSLLRSGDFGSFQFWVGGDRTVPFGPLPVLATSNNEIFPSSIMATGPGLNDWVVCYQPSLIFEATIGGANLAFAGHTGIIATRQIMPPSGDTPGLQIGSKGLFASHFVTTGLGGESRQGWTTTGAQESAEEIVPFSQINNFVLPNAFVSPWGGVRPSRLSDLTAIDPTLSHALHWYPTSGDQILWIGTTPVPLTSNISAYQSFSPALVNLVLHQSQDATLSPSETFEEATETLSVPFDRWQLFEDGTWNALPSAVGIYNTTEGYTRLDYSYYPV